ncbi:MAG: TetR/AcrR family transcriptional regulator [Steroidobacteraceae bacterium]
MNTDTPVNPRRPGRPRAGLNVQRRRLMQAARDLLMRPDGRDLALRQVALRAGVTPALAHYYFANRDGLLAALIEELAAPKIDDLLSAAQVRAAQPVAALTFLMQRLTSLAASDNFLCRCLLLPAAQPLRDRLRALLRDLLQSAQTAGLLRTDLSLGYLCDALLGLCLFPFLDAGAAANNAGERAAELTLQHVALLQDGIVHAHRPRHDAGS